MSLKKFLTKKNIIIIVCLLVIAISIGSYFLINYLRVKNAVIKVTLDDTLETEFLSDVKVSDFISDINGTIVDDYVIDTSKVGLKQVEFEYINEDNIKVKYVYEINIVDNVAPLIWLNNSYTVNVGSDISLTDKILCGDNYDNDPVCEVIGEYDMSEAGTYPLVFKATDNSGNVTEKEFNLIVREPKTSGTSSGGVSTKTLFSEVVDTYKNENTQIGIDISKWQGDVDFNALKESGVEFVIIRVGTSSGINGENLVDSKFEQNINGANKAGIPVGVYFYSYANSEDRAISDALWVLEQIKDYKVDLPIAFDWENWSFYNEFNLSFFGLSNMADSFVKTVRDAGYEGMLYSSKNYLEDIWFKGDYPVWLAHYTTKTNYEGDYEFWQLCNNGRVAGINGDVDINIRYLD